MRKTTITTLALAGVLALGSGTAAFAEGGDNALLDALVRKHVLSPKEADNIRADMVQESAANDASKIKLGNSISELKIYGDIRLRYQYDNTVLKQEDRPLASTVGSPDLAAFDKRVQQSRFRFRLRLNADFKLTDNFFGGVQLQTNSATDSGNQTFGSAYNNYSIFISRAYFGWAPLDGVTLIGGKQPNPFYTTDLVWDPDINPDGFTEKFEIHKLLGCGEQTVGYSKDGYSKDGKAVVTTSTIECPWELTLNLGQLIYQDNPENFFGTYNNSDVWQFVQQAVFSYKITPDVKFTIAPGYEAWIAGNTGTGGAAVGFTSTRNLSIITAPGDVSFKVFGLKTKVLWDFAYNTDGGKRFHDVLGVNNFDAGSIATNAASLGGGKFVEGQGLEPHSATDNLAFLAGFQVGENKKKGDWSFLANYRQTGVAAVDPNENDSDFALSYLNTRGFKVGVAYNFTDFCVGAVTFMDAWQLRGDITQGVVAVGPNKGWTTSNAVTGPSGAKLAGASNVQVLQVDLSVKF